MERQGKERLTVPIADACTALGFSRTWVAELLDRPDEPLQGPPAPGRGRGPRLVYVDTIADQAASRPRRKRRNASRPEPPAAGQHGQHGDVLALTAAVAELMAANRWTERRLADIERHHADDGENVDNLVDVVTRLNVAHDLLDKAFDLQRQAADLQLQAAGRQEEALDAVRAAHNQRVEALGLLVTTAALRRGGRKAPTDLSLLQQP